MNRLVARKGNMVMFWCPGCNALHSVDSTIHQVTGGGSALTVSPSILEQGGSRGIVCHSFLNRGVWQFLPDSTHASAGQNVPMRGIPDEWRAGIHGAVFDAEGGE